MIIGADVSHAAPGLEQASMAAMTVSLDLQCCRYGAAVESNGKRVEMITGTNIRQMLTPLVDWWVKNVGNGQLPKHVYYFRDGVSEGQYIPLLKYEVADMKLVFDDLGNAIKERRVSLDFTPCFRIQLLIFNSLNSLLLSLRSGIIFVSSLQLVPRPTRTETRSQVPLLRKMSLRFSRMMFTFALMQLFKAQLDQRITQCSWMKQRLMSIDFRRCCMITVTNISELPRQYLCVSALLYQRRS